MPRSRIRRRSPYTPPTPTQKSVRIGSPRWLVPVMIGCFVLGLLWIVVYYVSQTDYPIGSIGPTEEIKMSQRRPIRENPETARRMLLASVTSQFRSRRFSCSSRSASDSELR